MNQVEAGARLLGRALLLAATAALALLAIRSLGKSPLEGDEARYALMARTVADTSVPYPLLDRGLPYWSKPPTGVWIEAATAAWAGSSPASARLPNALAGCLGVVAFLAFLDRRGRPLTAVLAALLLVGTARLYLGRGLRFGGFEGYLLATTWIALAQWSEFRRGGDRRRLLVACLAAATGAAIKGPAILAYTLPGALAWEVLGRSPDRAQEPRRWRELGWWMAAPIAVCALWLTAVAWFGGQGGLSIALGREVGDRLTGELPGSSPKAFSYYAEILYRDLGAWLVFGLVAVVALLASRAARSRSEAGVRVLEPLLLTAPSLLALSLTPTRLEHYAAPLLPGVCWLVAAAIDASVSSLPWVWIRRSAMAALVALALARLFDLESQTRDAPVPSLLTCALDAAKLVSGARLAIDPSLERGADRASIGDWYQLSTSSLERADFPPRPGIDTCVLAITRRPNQLESGEAMNPCATISTPGATARTPSLLLADYCDCRVIEPAALELCAGGSGR